MAKKVTGPKEAQLKALREQAAEKQEMLPFDSGAILAEIEAFKASKVQPIRDEIAKLEVERDQLDAKLDQLRAVEAQLTGRALVPVIGKTEGGKRVRRSKEQMAEEARQIFAFVQAAGKDGVSGGDIRAKYPGAGQYIVKFVEENGGGTLKTTGQKAATRYHA